MTNHAAEARSNLSAAEAGDWEKDTGPTFEHIALMAAQVHATLALADEQHTANLIACLAAGFFIGHDFEDTAWADEVYPRLGLTPITPNQEQSR